MTKDIKPKQVKRKRRKKYLEDHELYAELEKSHKQGELTDQCAKYFMLMTKNIISQYRYEDPQDREDCYWGAVMVCCQVWHKFDMTRTRPFPYFSRVIYNGIYASWNQLAKSRADISTDNIFLETI